MARRSGSEKRQRTTIVTMRINPQEAAAIRQIAQKRGESVSALMRSALLHNRPRASRIDLQAVAQVRPAGALVGAVNKIGSNINQIACQLNAAGPRWTASLRNGHAFKAMFDATWRSCALSAFRRSARNPGGSTYPE